jgi:uncharacterized membrane protein
MNWLRPFLSRLISTLVAALAAWLTTRYGINLDTETQGKIIEDVVTIVLPVFGIVNSVVHKLIDKRINPGDTASSHLAVTQGEQARLAKNAASRR